MFEVKLDGVDALLKKFDAVTAQVHSLQYTIPREFEGWRTDDMNSRYPNPQIIRRGRRTAASPSASGTAAAARPRQHPRPKHRRRRRGHSRRPVLRPELYEQLKERMIKLVTRDRAMAVNLDVLLQSPIFDFYAVPVTFTPLASQPGQPAYQGRGILDTYTEPIDGGSTVRSSPTSAPFSTFARASSRCCRSRTITARSRSTATTCRRANIRSSMRPATAAARPC